MREEFQTYQGKFERDMIRYKKFLRLQKLMFALALVISLQLVAIGVMLATPMIFDFIAKVVFSIKEPMHGCPWC